MTIYTTPLQFAYFFGLLIAILLWVRSYREERQSDALLGFVMFFLAMEIQDYTFGFAGINYLWEEMNGFPRYFHLAFGPTIYFYLRSQTNKDFRLERIHYLHYIPYAIYVIIYLFSFLQGKEAVDNWQKSTVAGVLSKVEYVAIYVSYAYYFYKSLQLYAHYRKWIITEFSDTESVSLVWVRNFIYLILSGEVFKLIWSIIDKVMGDLPFEQDWWWHLFTVCIIIYVGLKGYTQRQPKNLLFKSTEESIAAEIIEHREDQHIETLLEDTESIASKNDPSEKRSEFERLLPKLEKLFDDEKIYLDSDLSLSDLAHKLKTNSSILSAAINQTYGKNFNDFVNEYRIKEYEDIVDSPKNKQFTKLAIAMNCGFNSRATFHRAFKKFASVGVN